MTVLLRIQEKTWSIAYSKFPEYDTYSIGLAINIDKSNMRKGNSCYNRLQALYIRFRDKGQVLGAQANFYLEPPILFTKPLCCHATQRVQ